MQPAAVTSEPAPQLRLGNALGVFFVALSTLVLEIALTRIFSVTLWYHFGGLAVSLAMFGVGASGVFVYVLPNLFKPAAMGRQLYRLGALFGVSIAVCSYLQLHIHFVPVFSLSSVAKLTLLYAVTAVPFFLSGLCISLIFTHLPAQIGKLYFMDLLGAGLGCILAVATMSVLTAPNVVLLSAVTAGLGSLCFATATNPAPIKRSLVLCAALLALLFTDVHLNVFRFDFAKGAVYERPEYERWNSYAYIGIWGARSEPRPSGWGLSETWRRPGPPERMLKIDAGCATVITEFTGDLGKVEHLKCDVASIGHYLFQDHQVLVIGAGGGRDVLASLGFGARAVHALEYNASIVEAVNDHFAAFSGRVYDLPRVHKIIAEGRSYVQRSPDAYDLIQLSLVDSWAANASGAYVMAENFLYTKEAFAAYFDRLTDQGVLSITRFYLPQAPQLLRVVSIAAEVLRQKGIARPENHLMVILKGRGGTVLISKPPFTPAQVQTVDQQVRRLQFNLAWAPGQTATNAFAQFLTAGDPKHVLADFVYDISAPTDDKPFFFHMANSLKALRHTLQLTGAGGPSAWNVKWYGTFVLLAVLLIATTLAILCILLPLYFKRADLRGLTGIGTSLGYFACLGVGFMLVEIPLMQRFTFFLGHPVYALSVILFSLLVFAGCGSLLSSRMRKRFTESYLRRSLLLLIVALVAYNLLLPAFMNHFLGLSTAGRITLAVLALLPLGLLLGMPLPLGMRVLAGRAPRLIPWLWGINGACSVFASLFAIALAMTVGFTWTMLVGTAAYLLALTLTRSYRGVHA